MSVAETGGTCDDVDALVSEVALASPVVEPAADPAAIAQQLNVSVELGLEGRPTA